MSGERKDGAAAFPRLHSIDGNWIPDPKPEYSGMSLRDYFAARALQGLLSDPANASTAYKTMNTTEGTIAMLTGIAYDYADMMIKAREQ